MGNDRDLLDVELVLQSPVGARRISVGHIPVIVGMREHSHLRVPPVEGEIPELAIWQQNRQVMLRAVPVPVLINDRRWNWAILDDGDEINIGGLRLTVAIKARVEEPPADQRDDRRTSVRLPVDAPGTLVDHPRATDERTRAVQVADLSDGGARVLTSVELRPGERVTIEVLLPPDGTRSRIPLHVLSVQPGPSLDQPFSAHCSIDG